jgi:hypothetical protein
MKVTNSNDLDKFPYILVDNFYNQQELNEIWEELDYMCSPKRMNRSSIENGGAWDKDEYGNKQLLKHNWTMWLDPFFVQNRQHSNILGVNRKLFHNMHLFTDHPHWLINDVDALQKDFSQIAYYEDSDVYKVHRDYSRLTCLTWFFREPKKFTGGNLQFPLFDIEIECKNNRMIIFPGAVPHAATKVCMEEEHRGKKLGRFVMVQLLKLDGGM